VECSTQLQQNSIKGVRLDARARLLLVPVFGIAAFVVDTPLQLGLLGVIAAALLFLSGNIWLPVRNLIILTVLLTVDVGSAFLRPSGLTLFLTVMLYVLERMCLLLTVAAVFTKFVPTAQQICTMEALHIPRQAMIPLAVAIRFIPSIREDFSSLRDSMRIRGIDVSIRGFFRHPVAMLEYTLVPLLIRSLKTSDELSASAMVRGIDSGIKKTPLYELRWRFSDTLITVLVVGSIIAICIFL
jgi:energy-coupling factor transport system permease protein